MERQAGASLIEYALVVGVIVLVAAMSLGSTGDAVSDKMCEAAFGIGHDGAAGAIEAYFDEDEQKCCIPAVGWGPPLCM